MRPLKPHPVDSVENLRERVDRLFRESTKRAPAKMQLSLDLPSPSSHEKPIVYPSKSIGEFLNFIADALPDGEVYLFGGVLRDLALLGRKGFNSDIDVVVEGAWHNCVNYLESSGAHKNKFGGYRLEVAGWPVDIWNARETWAIKQNLVKYKSIASLTETTVLNWDAILMNWRTRTFVFRSNYLEDINTRTLDIVLEKNPNPLGMAVRVFRHFSMKDARRITPNAAMYMANCTHTYSFDEIMNSELRSYGNSEILLSVYRFFHQLKTYDDINMRSAFSITSDIVKKELGFT